VNVLLDVARGVGLDGREVRAYLEGDAGTREVHTLEAELRRRGISGVPAVFVKGELALVGAMPTAQMVRALRHAAQRQS